MATLNITVNSAKSLKAQNQIFNISELVEPSFLNIFRNNDLGVQPTYISNVGSPTGTDIGAVMVYSMTDTPDSIEFIPNGTLGTMMATYTIADSTGRTSTAFITINTI